MALPRKHIGDIRAEAPLPGGLLRPYDITEFFRPDDPENPQNGGTSHGVTWLEQKTDIIKNNTEFKDPLAVVNLDSLLDPGIYQVDNSTTIGLPTAIPKGGGLQVWETSEGLIQLYLVPDAGVPTMFFRYYDVDTWGIWRKATTTSIPYD